MDWLKELLKKAGIEIEEEKLDSLIGDISKDMFFAQPDQGGNHLLFID